MPVYVFRCPECLEKEDALVDMANRNDTRLHSCGATMERLITAPRLAIIKVYGRDKICHTLNEEHKRPIVGGSPVRSKRSQEALARGLDYMRPLEDKVFTGF